MSKKKKNLAALLKAGKNDACVCADLQNQPVRQIWRTRSCPRQMLQRDLFDLDPHRGRELAPSLPWLCHGGSAAIDQEIDAKPAQPTDRTHHNKQEAMGREVKKEGEGGRETEGRGYVWQLSWVGGVFSMTAAAAAAVAAAGVQAEGRTAT